MAQKIKLTRPELKRQRDLMARFARYLPMLKLKQQQLQWALREVVLELQEAKARTEEAQKIMAASDALRGVPSGTSLEVLCKLRKVITGTKNIAGVQVPVFEGVEFPPLDYSFFATAAWVDARVKQGRDVSLLEARLVVVEDRRRILQKELTKVLQRVNLFEKVKIPQAKVAIRLIRIRLGDEMTAAVGRGKLAKNKLS